MSNAKVIKFSASWCQPCKIVAPMFESMSEEYVNVDFVSIDIDEDKETTAKYDVMSVPTLVAVDSSGKEVARASGIPAINQLRSTIEELNKGGDAISTH